MSLAYCPCWMISVGWWLLLLWTWLMMWVVVYVNGERSVRVNDAYQQVNMVNSTYLILVNSPSCLMVELILVTRREPLKNGSCNLQPGWTCSFSEEKSEWLVARSKPWTLQDGRMLSDGLTHTFQQGIDALIRGPRNPWSSKRSFLSLAKHWILGPASCWNTQRYHRWCVMPQHRSLMDLIQERSLKSRKCTPWGWCCWRCTGASLEGVVASVLVRRLLLWYIVVSPPNVAPEKMRKSAESNDLIVVFCGCVEFIRFKTQMWWLGIFQVAALATHCNTPTGLYTTCCMFHGWDVGTGISLAVCFRVVDQIVFVIAYHQSIFNHWSLLTMIVH